jgi:Tfp pilus assembly protein PilN
VVRLTMAQLHLDFVRPRRTSSAWGWLLLLVGAGIGLGLAAWDQQILAGEIATAQQELTIVRSTIAANEPASLKLKGTDLASEWQRASTVSRSLSAPWTELFAMLEGYADQPIALLGMDPDLAKNDLVLSGEARDVAAVLDYVRYLKKQPMLSAVTLQSHQVSRQDRDKPVRFRIVANWSRVQ